jgi:phage/conjugal plasmid C-4 type zinc finger TraR family protein
MDEADLGNMIADKYLKSAIAKTLGANNYMPDRGGAPDGICEDCGAIIPLPRREAVPGCRFCIECQREREKRHA